MPGVPGTPGVGTPVPGTPRGVFIGSGGVLGMSAEDLALGDEKAGADAKDAPRTKTKPGPRTRPLSTIRKNIGSRPDVPAPSGRSAAPTAAPASRCAW